VTPSLAYEDIVRAAKRLEGRILRTPTLSSTTLNRAVGVELFLKAECLQATGSFKVRGATNAVANLSARDAKAGVVTFSSGNHAQGVARAGRLAGVDVVVVMPHDAPPNKAAATEADGARIVRYDRYREDRSAIAASIVEHERRVLIPPYDHLDVMAGQGTVGLELLDDVAGLDTLITPVGGGGLLAGCATAVDATDEEIIVIGVEPEASDDHQRSRIEGKRVDVGVPHTIADGQQVSIPGALTWPVTNRLTSEFATVSDDEIIAAMQLLHSATGLMVEPSGASGVAAVLAGRCKFASRVGVVLSGGNITAERFKELTGI